MSKYHKLESNHENDDDNSTYDDSFSLYFDNPNHSNSSVDLNHSNSNGNNNSNNYNDNNKSHHHSTNHNNNTNTTMDLDESTMEVPLLNNNNNDYEQMLHCRCDQPGFGANLINKSTQEAKFKIICAISLCGVFMIIEFLGGYLAGSLAIMTDAAHLASDCISFVIGLVAIWLGGKPPDRRMSFGYKRMEVLGAVASILGIWILTATLVMMALERMYSNDFDLDANTMMTISGIGILINIVMVYILHGSALMSGGGSHGHSHCHAAHAHSHSHSHSNSQAHSHSHLPHAADNSVLLANGNGIKPAQISVVPQEKNLNLRAAMIHVIGDLVQSIGVFLASVLIKFYPSAKFADPLCTLLFSVIVIMTTVRLFKESVGILMDAVPQGINVDDLTMDLSHIDGVKSVHHLNVWNHTADHSVLMVHLIIDLLTDSNTVLDKATKLAGSAKYNIKHCTVQIERLTA